VDTTSLIPSELVGIPTGDAFLARLPEFDDHFNCMRREAAEEGMVLRYVGVIDVERREIKASLEKYVYTCYCLRFPSFDKVVCRYPKTHPFATSLRGSDNIMMFHTERYARPLIVQGAGAGAEVTAMGVMNDLLKLM
jgi:homoserine dehydrogenase